MRHQAIQLKNPLNANTRWILENQPGDRVILQIHNWHKIVLLLTTYKSRIVSDYLKMLDSFGITVLWTPQAPGNELNPVKQAWSGVRLPETR